ncbi:MAG: amino acid adenylation domain-containing protein, partial [Actinomycetota bacterium]
ADLLDRYDAAALEEPAGPGAPTATTIGIAGSVRDHPELDDVIGYFLNTLPLSVPVDRDTTIADRVTAVEGSLATALRHRHVPYHEIVSARRANGDREPDPISVLFVVDETFDASFGDAEVTSDLVHNGTAVAPLTMFVRPVTDGFEASAEWDTTQFDGTRVAAFLDSFTILTEWASRHSDEPIPATLLADDAVGPPLADSATTLTHTIVDAIDGNGADPEALAVRCGDQRLSWGELRDRSDRWARALAERHVGRGDRVVVALPRSVDLIVAIVGVLRSGACVVPVDATSPTARIDAVIDATGSTLAIDPTVAQALDDATPSDSTPGSRPRPDDDAYVIFTSGSTGRPRGVPVRHRELIASTAARLDRYAERPSTYLLTSSIGFDSSAAGLYWTLLVGGALALPTDDEVHDVDALLALAADASISHLLTVPSMYDTLLRRHPERLGSLQRAIVAGEACPPAVARRHHDVLPTAELTNEYGPSEATVWASAHDVAPTDDPVPIGRPIPGVRLRVVDRSLRARPPGLPGELVIAGPGVTRGYLDDEPATAASFPTDSDGNRWYRTGDLVRREGDVFTFLGRVDHQLSIGGVRLEPEEIESVIASVPGVTAAIVRAERRIPGDVLSALRELPDEAIARVAAGLSAPGPVSRDDDRNHEVDDDRSDGSPRAADRFADLVTVELAATAIGSEVLVAHVEAASDTDPDDVRRVVADTLPGHAVPAFVQIHEALPRTPNGKVDRHALGPPVRAAATDDGSSTYGQRLDDAGVELVVAAFRSVLGRDDIGPDTDFFDVGDSLSAVELATDLEEQVGRRVAIGLLLAARTPRAIAVALDLTDDSRRTPGLASDDSLLVELKPGRRVRSTDGPVSPLLVMPHAGGNLVPFDGLVQALDDRLPVIGFELPGARHDDEFPESLGALVDRYLDELLVAHPTGPYRFLGWSFGGVVALELARRLEARGEIVDLVAMIDTLVPGMQRSDRGAAYREAYADGGVGAVAQRIGRSLAYRAEYALGEIRGRRAARTGERLSAADRNTWLTIRIDEIVEAHPPPSWGGPVLYFAAIDTPRQRSTGPWADLLTGLEIVDVDGHHDGPDGLLASHTDELARTLSDRLV